MASESDDKIRARMKKTGDVVHQYGYRAVAFMKPGVGDDGEQHRYKPQLWERDPYKAPPPTKKAIPRGSKPATPKP